MSTVSWPVPATTRPPASAVAPVRRVRWRTVTASGPPPHPAPALRGARVLVFGGTHQLARAVCDALRAAGAEAHADESGRWPVAGEAPDGLVDLGHAEPFVPGEHHGYRRSLLRSVTALRACYPYWRREPDAHLLFYVVVTYLGGAMGYDAPDDAATAEQPLGGIWAGLAKTVHREIANCNTRVVDTDPADLAELPRRITHELYRWGLFEVGYRAGRRRTLEAAPEDAGPPGLSLDTGDLVLLSGGGRGIGWRLARTLAARHGCRVVVTGRGPLPGPDDPSRALDDEQFKVYEQSLWAQRRQGRGLAAVRTAVDAARRDRELVRHLDQARRAGLRISYTVCDVTDRDQTAALVARYGKAITAVVHNAGVDTPARLPKKTDDEFLSTVATKVDGFVNLFCAVRELPLKFFCNVGSLTGRLGGMVGQLDYAAANDGLARLGLWAQARVAFPVMTLCWPTWDRLGMVANFEATLRYMAALDVQEGLDLWTRELTAASRGEITYIGPLGRALGPLQSRGYRVSADLPGHRDVLSAVFHLGDLRTHVPHTAQEALFALDSAHAPVLNDVLVGGEPALPVSLLLENAVRGAAWVQPEDYTPLALQSLEDVYVALPELRLRHGRIALRRSVTAGYADGRWTAHVRFHHADTGHEAARLCLAYRRADAPSEPYAGQGGDADGTGEPYADGEADTDDAAEAGTDAARHPPHLGAAGLPLRWSGLVLRGARWRTGPQDTCTAEVRETPAGDLWVLPSWPVSTLPLTALENVFRRTAEHAPGAALTVRRLEVRGGIPSPAAPGAALVVRGSPGAGRWTVSAADGDNRALRLSGVTYRGDQR
ncbi:SDR family NAD(P)-dependent oxidoreductase [Streptomyces sp. NBC_01485]|uniref:SDR family NAD(P)-dependent oxidoreductase n=1 Tax=Streptomyces sp. NBC_01485 TaxID=2903884 RepID=UPI002E3252F5|nr:SDR family NAD(P)-dependent oxidoreductase [Streptomyces sp. NBC_01485]